MAEPVEAILLRDCENEEQLLLAELEPPRAPRVGGRLRHPQTAAIGPRIGESDPDGRRIEVFLLTQLLLLDDPDPKA